MQASNSAYLRTRLRTPQSKRHTTSFVPRIPTSRLSWVGPHPTQLPQPLHRQARRQPAPKRSVVVVVVVSRLFAHRGPRRLIRDRIRAPLPPLVIRQGPITSKRPARPVLRSQQVSAPLALDAPQSRKTAARERRERPGGRDPLPEPCALGPPVRQVLERPVGIVPKTARAPAGASLPVPARGVALLRQRRAR